MAETKPPQSSTTLVIVAAVIAVIAVILVNIYVEAARRQATPGEFTVYRLTRSVRPGDTLHERDAEGVKFPDTFKESMSNALDPTGLQTRLGDTLYRGADRGAPLTYDLFKPPENNNLDQMIQDGMRLVSLPVNSRRMAGVLRPGMYIDLEGPFPNPGGSIPNVLTVMERVRVLSVGSHSVIDERQAEASARRSRGSTNFSSISIEVTPRQATELAMIGELTAGDFIVELRKPSDTGTPKIPSGGINPKVLALLQ